MVYDDGCHLAEFVNNHFGNDLAMTSASQILKSTPFSIDRVHYKNHVGRWCRENMNPDNNRCEQLCHVSNTYRLNLSLQCLMKLIRLCTDFELFRVAVKSDLFAPTLS